MKASDQPRILILSDSPSCTSGLGRITRDLALRLHGEGVQVATLGYGGPGSVHLPFPQYHIHDLNDWLVPELPLVWEDWFGPGPGTLLTIWDPSRLQWLARPAQCRLGPLRQWLERTRATGMMRLWGYLPIDAWGPERKLAYGLKDCIAGYDRVLCYSRWAAEVVQRTFDDLAPFPLPDHLPHGIDLAALDCYLTRPAAREQLRGAGWRGLQDSSFMVGIVATNQPRKDFGLGLAASSLLAQQGVDVRVWIHTDALHRHWDLSQLALDMGLGGRVIFTTSKLSDAEMATAYRACDLTLGIGLGEGFGFPLFESLACGTPVVHGNYGGAAEHLPDDMLVEPLTFRYEGQWACARPVFTPEKWAKAMWRLRGTTAELPGHLDWRELWPRWWAWFQAGWPSSEIQGTQASVVHKADSQFCASAEVNPGESPEILTDAKGVVRAY